MLILVALKRVQRITQYGTVYRDCHGWSSIIAIHKEISVFTQSSKDIDIRVENMQKSITQGMKYRKT